MGRKQTELDPAKEARLPKGEQERRARNFAKGWILDTPRQIETQEHYEAWRAEKNAGVKEWDTNNPVRNTSVSRFNSLEARARRKQVPFHWRTADEFAADHPNPDGQQCPALGVEMFFGRPGIGRSHPQSASFDEHVPGKGYLPGLCGFISHRASAVIGDMSLRQHESLVALFDLVEEGKPLPRGIERSYDDHTKQQQEWLRDKAGNIRGMCLREGIECDWADAPRNSRGNGFDREWMARIILGIAGSPFGAWCPVLGTPFGERPRGRLKPREGQKQGQTHPMTPAVNRLVTDGGYVAGNLCWMSQQASGRKSDGTAAEHRACYVWRAGLFEENGWPDEWKDAAPNEKLVCTAQFKRDGVGAVRPLKPSKQVGARRLPRDKNGRIINGTTEPGK